VYLHRHIAAQPLCDKALYQQRLRIATVPEGTPSVHHRVGNNGPFSCLVHGTSPVICPASPSRPFIQEQGPLFSRPWRRLQDWLSYGILIHKETLPQHFPSDHLHNKGKWPYFYPWAVCPGISLFHCKE